MWIKIENKNELDRKYLQIVYKEFTSKIYKELSKQSKIIQFKK